MLFGMTNSATFCRARKKIEAPFATVPVTFCDSVTVVLVVDDTVVP